MRIAMSVLGLLLTTMTLQVHAQTYKVHTSGLPTGVTKPIPSEYLYLEGESLIYDADYGFIDANDKARTRYRSAQHPDDSWWGRTTAYDGSRFGNRGSDISQPWHLLAWDISDKPLDIGVYDAYARVFVTPGSSPQSGVDVAISLDDDSFDPINPEDDPQHIHSSTQGNIYWIPAGSIQITDQTQHVRLHIKTQYSAVRVDTVLLVKAGVATASADINSTDVTVPAWHQNRGWVFNGSTATVGFTSNSPQDITEIRYAIRTRPDQAYNWQTFQAPVNNIWQVSFSEPGWYDVSVRAITTDSNSQIVKVTDHVNVAILGDAVSETWREQSIFGMWNVNGDSALVKLANARWNRDMTSFRDVTQAEAQAPAGTIIPPYIIKNDLKHVGVFSFGMPLWSMDLPTNYTMPSFGNPFYPANDWADVTDSVAAYARSRSLPTVMEMYNEPLAVWHGTNAELVDYAHAVRQGLLEVDASFKLVGPCLYSIRVSDLENLAQEGLMDELDGLSMHAYVEGTPPENTFLERVVALNDWRVSWGQQNKPVYFSEFGWTRGKGTWLPSVSEWAQACYTARSQALVWSQGVDVSMAFCLQYNTSNEGEAGFGLLDEQSRPMPSYVSFAQVAKWFAASTPIGHFQLTPTTHMVMGYRNNKLQIGVWDETQNRQITLPFTVTQVVNMVGVTQATSATFQVGPEPIYIQADLPTGMVSLPSDSLVTVNDLNLVSNVIWPIVVSDTSASLPSGRYACFFQDNGQWRVVPVQLESTVHFSDVQMNWPQSSSTPLLSLTLQSDLADQSQQATVELEDASGKSITLDVPAFGKRQMVFGVTDYVAGQQNSTTVKLYTQNSQTYSQVVVWNAVTQ